MTSRFAPLSAVLLAVLLLAACGQTGPLQLPEDPDTDEPQTESPAPDSGQSE